MLPPGHIAAGYLASEIVLRTFNFNLEPGQYTQFLMLGTFFGFVPDLDFFLAFAKSKSFKIENDKVNHRRFLSHVPLLWLGAAALLYLVGSSTYTSIMALLLVVGTWTHFVLDSEWGIMWLWPFKDRMLPFSPEFYKKKYQTSMPSKDFGFWKYWFRVLEDYFSKPQGLIEILIVIIAIVFLYINHIN